MDIIQEIKKRVRWSRGGLQGTRDSFPKKRQYSLTLKSLGEVNISISIDHLDKLFI